MKELSHIVDKKPNLFRKAFLTEHKYFNWKLATMGGTFGGTVVYFINKSHGFWPAFFGGGKQFAYNFLVGGINSKLCETLATKVESKTLALTYATIIPTIATFAVNYAVHKIGGTPEAFASSSWQIPINATAFFIFGIGYRKNYDKENLKNLQ